MCIRDSHVARDAQKEDLGERHAHHRADGDRTAELDDRHGRNRRDDPRVREARRAQLRRDDVRQMAGGRRLRGQQRERRDRGDLCDTLCFGRCRDRRGFGKPRRGEAGRQPQRARSGAQDEEGCLKCVLPGTCCSCCFGACACLALGTCLLYTSDAADE